MNVFLQTSPESAGISSAILLRMMSQLNELKYVNSVIILRHGRASPYSVSLSGEGNIASAYISGEKICRSSGASPSPVKRIGR